MKTVVYPGTFNPWHEGHDEVLAAAMKLFDKVIIAVGQNPDKPLNSADIKKIQSDAMNTVDPETDYSRVSVTFFDGLLADFIGRLNEEGTEVDAVIRGMRNAADFEAEKNQQYHNEDLGLWIPTIYLVASRDTVHISSSAIRAIEKARKSGS